MFCEKRLEVITAWSLTPEDLYCLFIYWSSVLVQKLYQYGTDTEKRVNLPEVPHRGKDGGASYVFVCLGCLLQV